MRDWLKWFLTRLLVAAVCFAAIFFTGFVVGRATCKPHQLSLVQDSVGNYRIVWPTDGPTNAVLTIITNKEGK